MAKPCLIVVLLVSPALAQRIVPPPEIATYRAAVAGTWVDAVLRHVPGQEDAAIDAVRSWSRDDLHHAWAGASVVIALLQNPDRRRFVVRWSESRIPVNISSADVRQMAVKARQLRQHPGRDGFLKRAALLHGDVAMLTGPSGVREPFTASFLLPRRVFATTGDGTQEGIRGGDVNWEFGRILLDGVDNVGNDRDVESWYAATMAYLIAVEHYDNPHFQHAERLFPRSAEIRYLMGCFHEALADARVQSVLREIRVPASTTLDVRSERSELNDAAEHFRAAVEHAPQHHEARLRHGRVLGRLGRHQDAASALRDAHASIEDPLLRYYAALFLGAEEEALDRLEPARARYEEAAMLFPGAQAPHLALSQLQHRRGDRQLARDVLAPALDRGNQESDDPWWTYYISCGRDAEARMQATHRAIHGQPQ